MSGRKKRDGPTSRGRRPRSIRTGVVQLVAALVVGCLGGVGAVVWLDQHRESGIAADPALTLEAGDRLTAAIDELRQDGVYVASDGRSLVDEDGERAIEAAVAAQEVPVYVVVWAPDQQIGLDQLYVEDVLRRELPDEDGFVYVWEGPEQGDVVTLGPSGGSAPLSGGYDFVGDPATTLVEGVADVSRDDFYTDYGDEDYWGGLGGGSVLGLFLASGIVGAVLVVAKVVALTRGRRRLLPGGWRLRQEDSP